ncbi:MAG TPA: hypothetical protein VLT58_01805, partial [Polyangia bacterium]|nr:hypothetical protein [Polyangia bacterium]
MAARVRADGRPAPRTAQLAAPLAALLFLIALGCRRPAAPPPPPPPPPALGTISVQLAGTDDGASLPVDVEALRASVA